MTAIHISTASDLIGKTIKWNAPAYRMNKPYSGIAKINSVDVNNRNPLDCETIEGDNLNYAFNDEYAVGDYKGILCYSDSDRFVTFEILNENE